MIDKYVPKDAVTADPRAAVTEYLRTKEMTPVAMVGLEREIFNLANASQHYGDFKNVPATDVPNFRNNMYVASEALRLIKKTNNPKISPEDWAVLDNYKSHIDSATKFIPSWVKVAVALALGLGTMVGWKRIVVTVGEKIGKQHLSYAQGLSAELTAMLTIEAADHLSMPVSTTHVLSSGVAGTMAANHSGLQWSTVRNLLMAWVLTLPASIVLAGGLFWLFSSISRSLSVRTSLRAAPVCRPQRACGCFSTTTLARSGLSCRPPAFSAHTRQWTSSGAFWPCPRGTRASTSSQMWRTIAGSSMGAMTSTRWSILRGHQIGAAHEHLFLAAVEEIVEPAVLQEAARQR